MGNDFPGVIHGLATISDFRAKLGDFHSDFRREYARLSACAQPHDQLPAFSPTRSELDSALSRPGLGPLHHSVTGPANTICAAAISPGPGSAHAATIGPGKAGRISTALHHNTAASPAKAPRTACCIGGGIPIPPNSKSPQSGIKTPLRVGHKNNRPGTSPGRLLYMWLS